MPAPRDHEVILKDLLDRGLAYMAKDQKGNPKPAVRWPGTLDLAHQRGLVSTETEILQMPLEDNGERAVVRAVACFERDSTKLRFTSIGTCSPQNAGGVGKTYPLEMAETRALTRAMKQGINIGNLSYADELPDDADDGPQTRPEPPPRKPAPARTVNTTTGEVLPARHSQDAQGFITPAPPQSAAPAADVPDRGQANNYHDALYDTLAAAAQRHDGVARPPLDLSVTSAEEVERSIKDLIKTLVKLPAIAGDTGVAMTQAQVDTILALKQRYTDAGVILGSLPRMTEQGAAWLIDVLDPLAPLADEISPI